jgi:hypothetical protein
MYNESEEIKTFALELKVCFSPLVTEDYKKLTWTRIGEAYANEAALYDIEGYNEDWFLEDINVLSPHKFNHNGKF